MMSVPMTDKTEGDEWKKTRSNIVAKMIYRMVRMNNAAWFH